MIRIHRPFAIGALVVGLLVAGAVRLQQSDSSRTPQTVLAPANEPPPLARRCASVGFPGTPPSKTGDVAPVYPEAALRAGVSGTVILETTIDERGAVVALRVVRSIPLLDQAAIDAVEQWTFSPAMLRGAPACVTMTVTVTFGPRT